MKDKIKRVKASHAVMPEEEDDDTDETVAEAVLKNSETALERIQRQEVKEAETGPEKMDGDMGK